MSAPAETVELEAFLRGVAGRTGLDVDGTHRGRMAQTVARLYEESGASSFDAYVAQLASEPRCYEALLHRLRVGETYFFREPAHFDLLRETVVPVWLAGAGGRTLQVWSAGCATGEEAYSVAITLDGLGLLGRARILGTDLSEQALHGARASTYSAWSLRRCNEEQREAWFRSQGRRFHLRDRYKGTHEWRAHNLVDGPPAGRFDVVFCRNVLIYLTPEALRAATASLHDALAPDGWLLLGASDPVLDHPGLDRAVGLHGVTYRRTGVRTPHSHAGRVSLPDARSPRDRGRAGDGRERATSRRSRRQAPPTPVPLIGSPASQRPAEAADAAGPDVVAAIRALGDTGELSAALELAETAIAGDPADPCLRHLAATIHLGAGRPVDAATAATAAIFLDPQLVAAHLLLAYAEQQSGREGHARRSYRNALELLRAMPADAEVPLIEGEAVAHLAAVVADQLRGAR